jgi:hypothetical protein
LQLSLKWGTRRWRESDIIRYCDMLEGFRKNSVTIGAIQNFFCIINI